MMKRIKYTLLAAALLVMAAGAAWGYMQLMEVRLSEVEVRGIRWAEAGQIEDLLLVDTSLVLFELDPVLLADRARRHAWVADADVARLPSGRLVVDVVEREPVALIVDARGAPTYFVDRNGYRMPAGGDISYDVPLVRGLDEAFHPMAPIGHAALRDLLFELPVRPGWVRGAISEIIVEGPDVRLWVVPPDTGVAVEVALGDRPMDRRLDVLTAFLEQGALHPSDMPIRHVDLRYNNQIVVKQR